MTSNLIVMLLLLATPQSDPSGDAAPHEARAYCAAVTTWATDWNRADERGRNQMYRRQAMEMGIRVGQTPQASLRAHDAEVGTFKQQAKESVEKEVREFWSVRQNKARGRRGTVFVVERSSEAVSLIVEMPRDAAEAEKLMTVRFGAPGGPRPSACAVQVLFADNLDSRSPLLPVAKTLKKGECVEFDATANPDAVKKVPATMSLNTFPNKVYFTRLVRCDGPTPRSTGASHRTPTRNRIARGGAACSDAWSEGVTWRRSRSWLATSTRATRVTPLARSL
jgi:hypothetical protein